MEYSEPETQVLNTLVRLSYESGARCNRRAVMMRLVFHCLGWDWDQTEAERLARQLANRRLIAWSATDTGDMQVWPMPVTLYSRNRVS